MQTWTPGREELAIILGLAKEAEYQTGYIEKVAPIIRTGERKRKISHVIACCEAAIDNLDEEARKVPEVASATPENGKKIDEPDPVKDPGAYNRKKISEAIEEAAAARVPNA